MIILMLMKINIKKYIGAWNGKHYLQTDKLPTDQFPKSIQKIVNAAGFSNTNVSSLRAKIVPFVIYFVWSPLISYAAYEFLIASGCHPTNQLAPKTQQSLSIQDSAFQTMSRHQVAMISASPRRMHQSDPSDP